MGMGEDCIALQNTNVLHETSQIHVRKALLVGLPVSVHQLMNVDRKINVVTNSVPGQLLRVPNKVVMHAAQLQHPPLMKGPLGQLLGESLIS